jgi:hypothetical protein
MGTVSKLPAGYFKYPDSDLLEAQKLGDRAT